MRRILAILAIFVLLATPAGAEPAEPVKLNWEEARKIIAAEDWQGGFVDVDYVGLEIWMPDFLHSEPLDEEEIRLYGYLAFYENPEQSFFVGITLAEQNMSYAEVLEWLPENGAQEVTPAVVNGIPAIRYRCDSPGKDSCDVITIVYEDGQVLEFSFAAGESFRGCIAAMAGSIRIAGRAEE